MKKHYSALLLVFAAAVCLLSGCGDHWRPHSRREVQAFLRSEFSGEEITVAKKYSIPAEEDGVSSFDRIWDCWYPDLPDVVFHVVSRRYTGGPVPMLDYSLYHDKDKVFWAYYMEQYLTAGIGCLDLWTTANDGKPEFIFSSMADVPQAAAELRAFYTWYEAQPHAGQSQSATCRLDSLSPPQSILAVRYVTFNTQTVLTANPRFSFMREAAELEEACSEMLKSYYAFYHLPSPDFSTEELNAFAKEKWGPSWTEGADRSTVPHLLLDGNPIPADLLADIGIEPCAGSGLEFSAISYGGLFELLTRIGIAPEGEPDQFSATGADGSLYVFSYSFRKNDDGHEWWYYTRDGAEVPEKYHVFSADDGAPVLRVGSEEFQAVTGLEFYGS